MMNYSQFPEILSVATDFDKKIYFAFGIRIIIQYPVPTALKIKINTIIYDHI